MLRMTASTCRFSRASASWVRVPKLGGLYLAHAVLNMGEGSVGVFPVQGFQDAVGIAEGIVDGLGGVIGPDHHAGGGLGRAAGGDIGQELHMSRRRWR